MQLCERMNATAQSIRYCYETNPDACVLQHLDFKFPFITELPFVREVCLGSKVNINVCSPWGLFRFIVGNVGWRNLQKDTGEDFRVVHGQ